MFVFFFSPLYILKYCFDERFLDLNKSDNQHFFPPPLRKSVASLERKESLLKRCVKRSDLYSFPFCYGFRLVYCSKCNGFSILTET